MIDVKTVLPKWKLIYIVVTTVPTVFRLSATELTGRCCQGLAQALSSDHCSLVELDLSVNELGPEGALQLCKALRKPGCPLEKLRYTQLILITLVFRQWHVVDASEYNGTCSRHTGGHVN